MKASEPVSPPAGPRLSPARRAGTIVHLVLLLPVTLLLAVVTLLLLLGLINDPGEFADQVPVILLGLVMTAGGGLYISRVLRRLVRGG